ncbi:Uncharacterised protein [Staphylococcus intermedius NCTC 11048]|uniref:Uncharacterized protein n=1 Tax=Staphylococcus intermedius NCTC 11048 TaxID=1141106 RepID=A0A380G044_STAIN|nr:Uncharacterised protein [Staphylococcus intermedius NCTC 11048]
MKNKKIIKNLLIIIGLLFIFAGLILNDNLLYYPIGICLICLSLIDR